jgi:hypothetical protein
MVQVRESSRFGFCYALGELIGETPTRYIYRNRAGTAFVSKGSLIHLAPCTGCVDYQEREEVAKRRQLAARKSNPSSFAFCRTSSSSLQVSVEAICLAI